MSAGLSRSQPFGKRRRPATRRSTYFHKQKAHRGTCICGLCLFWLTRSRSLYANWSGRSAVPPECPRGSFGLDNEDAPARSFLEMLRYALPLCLLPFSFFSLFFLCFEAALMYSYLVLLQRTTTPFQGVSRFYLRVSINLVNRAASSARPEREL